MFITAMHTQCAVSSFQKRLQGDRSTSN